MSDIGLLTTVYGKATKLKIINGESDINKGAIYENVVAQELVCHGFPLYYYNSKMFKYGILIIVLVNIFGILFINRSKIKSMAISKKGEEAKLK